MGNLKVETPSGMAAVIDDTAIAEFRGGLRGQSWLADEAGYDEARVVWNGSIDRTSLLTAPCIPSTRGGIPARSILDSLL